MLLACLIGCSRPPKQPNVGHSAFPAGPAASGPLSDGRTLTRTDILLELARIPHAEVQSRLGPHRIESHTHFTLTPLQKGGPSGIEVAPGFRESSPIKPFEGDAAWESASTSLDETRLITVDKAGSLHLENTNDHGYGIEALLEQNFLYTKMRYGPYIRHRPEGDEVERLRALGYEPGAALLEVVAPYVYLSTPSETTRLGRPAWQVSLSRQDKNAKHRASAGANQGWRGTTTVDSLDGYAVVDRQRGVLLELRLSVRFETPRGKAPPGTQSAADERVRIEAQHELRVVALGEAVARILPPSEWNEPPLRPRSNLEKQELLKGLVSQRP